MPENPTIAPESFSLTRDALERAVNALEYRLELAQADLKAGRLQGFAETLVVEALQKEQEAINEIKKALEP